MPQPAIIASAITKQYKGVPGAGLNGLSFQVASGAICGLLGPNGAGKTTTVRILSTLLRMDSGSAHIAGYDLATQAASIREQIGLVGQSAALDEVLTGRQNLELFGKLYHLEPRAAKRRASELLGQFGLNDAAERAAGSYSGGMRRRLDLAAGLIRSPQVLFIDEPTTGLDPLGRQEVWAMLRELACGGTTILLTTQYLEEADQLANQLVLIKGGTVVAEGTPEMLKRAVGAERLELVLRQPGDMTRVAALAEQVASGKLLADQEKRTLYIPVSNGIQSLIALAAQLHAHQLAPLDLQLRRPSLDEVFLQLTSAESSEEMR